MTNFKKTISYSPHYTGSSFRVWAFWIMASAAASFLVIYIYLIYWTVDLSYKIERELRLVKSENTAYQHTAENYAEKLETLREEGGRELGLYAPKDQIFIDRYNAVARAGI